MVKLSDIVGRKDLDLEVVWPHRTSLRDRFLERNVDAASVSELSDPGPWLQGSELLMTIGLLLPDSEAGCRDYLHRVAKAGAAAVAIGLGAELPHQQVPDRLIEAAAAVRIPLLAVPQAVPFVAVTKAFVELRTEAERRGLEWALQAQRSITVAATRPGPVQSMVKAFSTAAAADAVVLDAAGHVSAAHGPGAGSLPELLGGQLARMRKQPGRSASIDFDGKVVREVHPLGIARPRAWLLIQRGTADSSRSGGVPGGSSAAGSVAGGSVPGGSSAAGSVAGGSVPGGSSAGGSVDDGVRDRTGSDSAQHRVVTAGLISLLSLELERRHAALEEVWRSGRDAFAELVSSTVDDGAALALLGRAGINPFPVLAGSHLESDTRPWGIFGPLSGRRVRVLALSQREPTPGQHHQLLAEDLASEFEGTLVSFDPAAVFLLIAHDDALSDRLTDLALERNLALGIGSVLRPGAARVSYQQARAALRLSLNSGQAETAAGDADFRQMLDLVSAERLGEFALSVLGPVIAIDDSDHSMLATLRAYIDQRGNQDASATVLGIHRHTVRNRIARIERATGRDLGAPDSRLNVALALHAYDHFPQQS
ncbi:PucR family transcriptional regulator ligand-binding domain-containing protein [Saxibacter everestensis]|uniref:PucR family transcriptional regulator ligand-binding domain-containing protein n=1 Tax=Saxibacter everestensis TaxID=2909229 RepID=A0ABY8QQ64_9MICO|nr:PucR family transcriptional regulator ligand-binding domain-containing protein [Brevibacteriaceae bacterium ZFBP1038]